MKPRLQKARGYLLLALALLFMEFSITGRTPQMVVIAVTLMTFAVSLVSMNRLSQWLSIAMLGVGHAVFFQADGTLERWQEAWMNSLPFVVLFVTVPLLSLPIRIGGYVEYISEMLRRHAAKAHVKHLVSVAATFVLSAWLNIGALRIMHDLFGQSYREQKPSFVQAVTRGFSLSAVFSPYIAGIAIILHILQVPLYRFMMFSLVIVFAGLAVSVLLFLAERKKTAGESERRGRDTAVSGATDGNDGADRPRKTGSGRQLLAAFASLFALILILDAWMSVNLIVIIGLIAVTFPFAWTWIIRKWRLLPKELANYERHVLPNVHNECVLVVSASFFSSMVQLSPIMDVLGESVAWMADVSLIFMTFLMILIVLLLTLVCIHQIIPVTLFANMMASQTLHADPAVTAFALAVAWGLAGLTGPVTALTMMSTQLFQVSWRQLLRWNGKYILCMTVLATVLAAIYQRL